MRRHFLRAETLAGLMPGTLLAGVQAAAAGKPQKPLAASADPVEQVKQQMAGVPLQTMKLRDDIQML